MMSLLSKAKTIPKSNIYRVAALIVIALGILLISNFNLSMLFLALSLYLSYKIVGLLLSERIFDSKIFQLVVSVFFFILILQSLTMVGWLISKTFPLTWVIPFSSLLLLIFYFVLLKTRSKAERSITRKSFSPSDIIAISACVFVFLALIVAPVYHTGIRKVSSLFTLVNHSVDDGSHIGLLNDRIQFDRGVTVGSGVEQHSRSEFTDSYPAGWHSANAAIIKTIYPNIQTGVESTLAYIISKTFWFLVLVFIFVRTVFTIYKLYEGKDASFGVSVWVLSGSLLFTGWFLSTTYFEGFYNFLPQLITIPLFLLILMQLSHTHKSYRSASFLILPVLLCVGTALSWLLLFPLFAVALLCFLMDKIATPNRLTFLKDVLYEISRLWWLYILLIISLFVQLYASTQVDSSASFISSILMPGGIIQYPIEFYGFTFIGIILFLILGLKKTTFSITRPVLYFCAAILAFTSIVYVIQMLMIGHNAYYYFKALNAFTLVGILFGIVGIASGLRWLQTKTSNMFTALLALIITALALQFAYPGSHMFEFAKGTRVMTSATNDQVFNILKTNYTQERYDQKEVTIYYPDTGGPILNEVGTILLKANKPFSRCFTALKSTSITIPPDKFSATPIIENCKDTYKITYFVNPASEASMKSTISAAGLSNKVFIEQIAR